MSSFLGVLFECWQAAMGSLQSLLFSGMNNPTSLILYSQKWCSSPLIIFVGLLSITLKSLCLACAADSRPGYMGSHNSKLFMLLISRIHSRVHFFRFNFEETEKGVKSSTFKPSLSCPHDFHKNSETHLKLLRNRLSLF